MPSRRTKARERDRGCAFCGSSGNRTKEHVWPRWLHERYTEADHEHYVRNLGFGRTTESSYGEHTTYLHNKKGSVLTIQTRDVCARCNNGWMSKLEAQAKVEILNLMRTDSGLWVTLDPDSCTTLASWAIKTAWTYELSTGKTITKPSMRKALHNHQVPPNSSRVWFARHQGERDFSLPQASVTLSRNDQPWNSTEKRHALVTCIVFQGLAFLAYTVDGAGIPTPGPDPKKWIELWPTSEPVPIGPRPTVSDLDIIRAVSRISPGVALAENTGFTRSPLGVQQIKH